MTGPAGAGRPRGVLPRAGRRILFPGAQARNVTDSQLSWRDPALAGVAVLTAVLALLIDYLGGLAEEFLSPKGL